MLHKPYDLLEYLFGVDSSTVCRDDIAKIEPALKHTIPIPSKLYADSKKTRNIQQPQKSFPGLTAITDGAKQLIPRPKDKAKRDMLSLTIQEKRRSML